MGKVMIRLAVLLVLQLFSGLVLADLCGEEASEGAEYRLVSASMSLGSGFGASGFSLVDANFNGMAEVVFGTGSGFGANFSIVVMEYSVDAGEFQYLCQSSPFSSSIVRIESFSNASVVKGTMIAFADSSLKILDHLEGKFVSTINVGASIKDVLEADVDNDGNLEIAILTTADIRIYDANSFDYKYSYAYGGSRFASGQFSDVGGVELALNTGYVIEGDGASVNELWDYSTTGFSNFLLEAGDIDGDGLDEIVGADAWYSMRAFNADTQGVLWNRAADLDIDALLVMDVDADPEAEVFYGDGQWGDILQLDGATGLTDWSLANPDHGVTNIIAGNLDGDAEIELLWGAGYSSTGADFLHSLEVGADSIEWTSTSSEFGPYRGVAFGDLNGDDIADRIYASVESASGDGILTAVNGATNAVLWRTTGTTFGRQAWVGVHDVLIADIDGDGVNEVLVATDRLYDGKVYFLSAENGALTGSVDLEDGSPIYSLRVANIDDDDDLEILAGGGKAHTGATGVYVYVIDGPTRVWESTLPMLGNSWPGIWSLEAVDIDGDYRNEVVALWTKAYVLDPDTNSVTATTNSFTALAATIDLGTGLGLAYLGNASGELYLLASDASTTLVADICASQIDALDAISPGLLAFTCGGDLGLYNLLDNSISMQTTGGLDPQLGYNDRLVSAEVDGVKALLVAGGRSYYFTADELVSPPPPEAQPGSFEGHFNTSLQGMLSATDPEGEPLHFALYRAPQKGTVDFTNAASGAFSYTPPGNFIGEVTFEYLVTNGSQLSSPVQVSIALTDTAPSGMAQSESVHWSAMLTSSLSATDEDGDTLNYILVEGPESGTFNLDADTGEFSFQNTSGDLDGVTFLYKLSDGLLESPEYLVTITLTNTAPVAPNFKVTSYYLVDLATMIHGEDDDGDMLTFELVSPPDRGVASLQPSGLFSYTPDGGREYKTSLTYRVHDGRELSAAGEVEIHIVAGEVQIIEKKADAGALTGWVLLLIPMLLRRRRRVSNKPC